VSTIVLTLLFVLEPGASGRPAFLSATSTPPTIDWPQFFSSVSTHGLVYSDRLKALEGRRVRLRGYSIARPTIPEGILLTRIPFVESDPHADEDDLDIPYDAVGVIWRAGLAIPPVPQRPTVEGILRLGNHAIGSQRVAILLEDAAPVLPASAKR